MSPFPPDLQRIIASLGDGVWELDLATGQAWYSPRYMELLGYAHGELPVEEAGFARRGHPDDRAAIRALRERALASLQPCTGEGRMQTRGGEWRWFRATLRAWPNAEGRPVILCGSLTDVHVEKRAVEDAEKLADRFDRALAASSEAHFEYAANGDDFFISARVAELLGHPAGTPGPSLRAFLSWIHPDDRLALLRVERRAAKGPRAWEHDCRLRCADGSYRWFGGRGRSIFDSRGQLRITGTVSDIHADKTAQIEREKHGERLEQMVAERTALLSSALELAESRRTAAERANLSTQSRNVPLFCKVEMSP